LLDETHDIPAIVGRSQQAPGQLFAGWKFIFVGETGTVELRERKRVLESVSQANGAVGALLCIDTLFDLPSRPSLRVSLASLANKKCFWWKAPSCVSGRRVF
jgi:hypothetical protein